MERMAAILRLLDSTIGPVGISLLAFVMLLTLLFLLRTAQSRMVMVVALVAIYCISASNNENYGWSLPSPLGIAALGARFPFVIVFSVWGLLCMLTNRGASLSTILALLALCFLGLVGALLTPDPFAGFARAGILLLIWLGLIPGVANLVRQLGMQSLMQAMWWCSVVLAFVGMMSLVLRSAPLFVSGRFYGFMNNSNAYGFAASIMLMPNLWKIVEGSRYKSWCIPLAGWWGLTLLMSGSRAGILVILPVALAMILIYAKKPMMWIGGLVLLLILAVGAQLLVSEVVKQRLFSTYMSQRDVLWANAAVYIPEAPLFGHGLGWSAFFFEHQLHNSYLLMVLDVGYVGAVGFTLLFLWVALRALALRKRAVDPATRRIVILLSMLVFGMLLNGVGEAWILGVGGFQIIIFAIVLGALEGYVMSVSEIAPQSYPLEYAPEYDDYELAEPQ